jgi:zinc protease
LKKIIFSLIFLTFNSCAKYDAFEFALDNGLRVVCVKRNSVPIIAFSIWYKCGSKCDLVSKSGVAHYLEHTAFSSKKEFRDFLEEIGAECNAFTSFNTICFYEIVPKEHLETIFLNESDRMKSIQIDDTDFLSEKGAILEERSMRTDNDPEGAYQETMLANMFNRKTGGIGIIGWKHEINGIKKQETSQFYLIPLVQDQAELETNTDAPTAFANRMRPMRIAQSQTPDYRPLQLMHVQNSGSAL